MSVDRIYKASPRKVNSRDNLNEDDGFFSDVPVSGTRSKSLLALNKYMKKNLLYDDNVDNNEDSAYFSKESSPKYSVSKCDSDSVKSDESFNRKEQIRFNDDIEVNIKKSQPEVTVAYPDSNAAAPVQVTDSTELTDDYKTMQLRKENHIKRDNVAVPMKPDNYRAKTEIISPTVIKSDSENDNTIENEQRQRPNVIYRENNDSLKYNPNRHTLHDFGDWANRTTTYPDVYAPLPYKSPRRYVESDVNIHYRCPVRHDPLPLVPERELARQQAEHMKRLYREQRRNKYLQELQDMQNRRHQDNFTPAQKSIVPLNRYDEAERMVARALFAFNGQTPRELSFRKGDMINVRRQIDNNWYEGELHGRIGLFPYNYVEILKGDITTAKKPAVVEGRAKAKFDFTAQTNLELPLKKGEVVVLTRRIDQNWWEGRLGNNTGIFPDSYVTVLQEPTQNKPAAPEARSESKPAASPAAHGLVNGAAKRALAAHSYTPQHNSAALANAPPATQPLPGYVAKPAQATMPQERRGAGLNNTEPLYVDTNAEAVPYRAMYKYRPQNPDELELSEGDTVYVLEKCDDGWYVGSSQRTGRFGTFPGNYVERI